MDPWNQAMSSPAHLARESRKRGYRTGRTASAPPPVTANDPFPPPLAEGEDLFDWLREAGRPNYEVPAPAAPAPQANPAPSASVEEVPASQKILPRATWPNSHAPPTERPFDGTYTMASPKGGHRTFKIRTQPSTARFEPGKQILSLLTGPNNDSDFQGFATLEGWRMGRMGQNEKFWPGAWKKFAGSATEASGKALLAFLAGSVALREAGYTVEESRCCCRCGRTLTTPESIAAGIGPECIKKGLR